MYVPNRHQCFKYNNSTYKKKKNYKHNEQNKMNGGVEFKVIFNC